MNYRKIVLITCVLSLLFVNPQITDAHIRGVPILKINGVDAEMYPIQDAFDKMLDLSIETDFAPENYVVNQELLFAIDTSKIGPASEVFEKTDFLWDFGDESPKQVLKNGAQNTHIYKTPGTFVTTITADYAPAGYTDIQPQVIQTAVVTVLADKGYILPTAVIKINGKAVSPKKPLAIDLNKQVTFDATGSKGQAKITAYQWDFGDGKRSKLAIEHTRFKLPKETVTVLLRVKDANGYSSITYVTLHNNGKNVANNPEEKNNSYFFLILMLSMGSTIFLGLLGSWLFNRKKRSTTKKHKDEN